MKEILEYNGEIHMICRWAHELLGYHYSIINGCARMMRDVDAIPRRFSSSIGSHIRIASLLTSFDRENGLLRILQLYHHPQQKRCVRRHDFMCY